MHQWTDKSHLRKQETNQFEHPEIFSLANLHFIVVYHLHLDHDL